MNNIERLRAIVAFLPELESPTFDPGSFVEPRRLRDDLLSMPYADMSETADRFVEVLYANDWISEFSWVEWIHTDEAARLVNDPLFLAQADADQLCKLLTSCVRSDRFCEGALLENFRSGLILGIVRRADALLRELPSATE